jgi:hypothetical protein
MPYGNDPPPDAFVLVLDLDLVLTPISVNTLRRCST